jgi:hypothetical protein
MIRKTDKYLKRRARVWARGYAIDGEVVEIFQRETWWLFWIIPIYSRDTVIDKPR